MLTMIFLLIFIGLFTGYVGEKLGFPPYIYIPLAGLLGSFAPMIVGM